jgi:hypothetical protein
MIYARLTVNGIKMASLQPHCAGLSTAPHNPVARSGARGALLKNKTPLERQRARSAGQRLLAIVVMPRSERVIAASPMRCSFENGQLVSNPGTIFCRCASSAKAAWKQVLRVNCRPALKRIPCRAGREFKISDIGAET